jgi:hypothetical protein
MNSESRKPWTRPYAPDEWLLILAVGICAGVVLFWVLGFIAGILIDWTLRAGWGGHL